MRFIIHFFATRQRDATARDELRKRPLDVYLNSCRATCYGERNVFGNFIWENGDVLLVTQYGAHLWGFCPDKKAVQLLVRVLLQRFCTVSRKTSCVLHGDTALCRIALHASLCEKVEIFRNISTFAKVCDVLRRICDVANPSQAVASRCRIAKKRSIIRP